MKITDGKRSWACFALDREVPAGVAEGVQVSVARHHRERKRRLVELRQNGIWLLQRQTASALAQYLSEDSDASGNLETESRKYKKKLDFANTCRAIQQNPSYLTTTSPIRQL
jgi:hypothetical protein